MSSARGTQTTWVGNASDLLRIGADPAGNGGSPAIIAIERNVLTFRPATGLWDASRETALYLSNRSIGARKAADAVRKHWGIENKQHYTRDVTLREDASRIRRNPGIFARLRSFAYNILRFNQSDTIAQDRYAAALGGLEALSDMNYYKER